MNMYNVSLSFEHIGFGAVDTTALAQWYCDVFGLDIVFKTEDAIPIYFLGYINTEFKIEIFPVDKDYKDKEESIHFSFKVDNLDMAVEFLVAKGIECSSVKNMMQNDKTVFFKDPVGHILQVVERSTKLWT